MSLPIPGRRKPKRPRQLLLPVLPWEEERVYADGDAYFRDLLNDIEHASRSIDFEAYIFEMDFVGAEMVRALAGAARRGVRVRVLVDGIGSPTWSGFEVDYLMQAGVASRVFHPAPWHLWQLSYAQFRKQKRWLSRLIWLFQKINRRNHRKLCLIDERVAWVGSFNVSAVHLSREAGGHGWRDTAVRISGEGVALLQELFEGFWKPFGEKKSVRRRFDHDPGHLSRLPVRTNETRFKRRYLYRDLLDRIRAAKTRVWITNAYFVPDYHLLRALSLAAMKGVDVRLLLPEKSDVPMIPLASSTFYSQLLQSGVRIFEYRTGILHAKTLLIDHWALVGSSNFNHRSLLHDYELDVVLTLPESVKSLEEQFGADLTHSEEIVPGRWRKQHWVRKALGWLVLRIRYWL